MCTKSLVFGIAMLISFLPAGSYAQSPTAANSVEDINTSVIPDGSIVVISKEESGTPGYAHTRYAFVDQACSGGRIVDYYGPPVDLNDKDLQQVEQRMCTEVAMDTREELFEGSFEVFDDLLSENIGIGKTVGLFEVSSLSYKILRLALSRLISPS